MRRALALLLVAAALRVAVALPAEAAQRRAAQEQLALQDERRSLTRRLTPLERGEAARARALTSLRAEPLPEGREAPVLRRSVVATLAEAALTGVRVSVRPGRAEIAASVELAGQGGLDEVLMALDRLTRPGGGVVLSRLRLRAIPAGVAFELEGLRPRS
jgi:hypothetical protein